MRTEHDLRIEGEDGPVAVTISSLGGDATADDVREVLEAEFDVSEFGQ